MLTHIYFLFEEKNLAQGKIDCKQSVAGVYISMLLRAQFDYRKEY